MNPTTLLKKQDIEDLFLEYQHPEYAPYKDSKAFTGMVEGLYNYIIARGDSRDEKRQIMYHSKEVFEDYKRFEDNRLKGPTMQEFGWGSIKKPEKPVYLPYKDAE